jgi:hypothetical protein
MDEKKGAGVSQAHSSASANPIDSASASASVSQADSSASVIYIDRVSASASASYIDKVSASDTNGSKGKDLNWDLFVAHYLGTYTYIYIHI